MKQGKHFRIPEAPEDLQQLWDEAMPLRSTSLPSWLTVEDIEDYRFLGSTVRGSVLPEEQRAYLAELEELEAAGLITDPAEGESALYNLYISAPSKAPVWSIGIYEGDSPSCLVPSPRVQNPVLTYKDVSDVPAMFVADPFMLRVQGVWYLFFEVMNWRTGKGEIGLATSQDGYQWQYRQIVLAEPFHLSYPYVFAWQGDYYLVPESHHAGAVRLYKAIDFPTRWELSATLLEGRYFADASLLYNEGRWWMFVETSSPTDHDTLGLYFADQLQGPWCEHPRSPVVRGNPHLARPAGRILATEGKIVRYAQNCHPTYGLDVRALEIVQLTTTAYEEREMGHHPVLAASGKGWNAGGMHHVDILPLPDGRWRACVDGWTE